MAPVSLKGNWTGTKFAPVITPLISLVKDQTPQLQERNVDGTFLFAKIINLSSVPFN